MALWTIFRPKMHPTAGFAYANLKFFRCVGVIPNKRAPGSWTQTPVSAWLAGVSIVPILQNDRAVVLIFRRQFELVIYLLMKSNYKTMKVLQFLLHCASFDVGKCQMFCAHYCLQLSSSLSSSWVAPLMSTVLSFFLLQPLPSVTSMSVYIAQYRTVKVKLALIEHQTEINELHWSAPVRLRQYQSSA